MTVRHKLDLPSGRRLVTQTPRRYVLVYDGEATPRVIRRSDNLTVLRNLRTRCPGSVLFDLTTKEKL